MQLIRYWINMEMTLQRSYLANSLTFQSGVGTVTANKGLLTVTHTPGINIIQFSTVVITGYDSTSGVSASATLTTSTQIGTLSDFQLGTLTNADGKVLTDGDTSIFYASYTATDMSGNPTTSYDLIKGGLILHSDNAGNTNLLTTSNSDVTASVEQDPSDSTKAVIKVVASNTTGTPLAMDMPTVITAMTWTGKTSSLNTTLKKASTIDTFTIMSPSESIAVNEGKEIPFTALDQNGVALTKYADLKNANLTISNAMLSENADGTASLLAGQDGNGFATDGQQVITATTSTGKYSSLTINIQKYAKADTLALDSTVLQTSMQSNSNQSVDFGYNYGGFTVKDQYGRVLDMQGKASAAALGNAPAYNYEVLATTSGDVTVSGTDKGKNLIAGGAPIAAGANGIKITANDGLQTTGGTGTVTFSLIDLDDTHAGTVADPHTVIDSKSVTLQILKNTDIKDYTMDTVAKPIYADASTTGAAMTDEVDAFAANPLVWGKSGSGSKVVLAGDPIIGAFVDSTDFMIDTFSDDPASTTTYDGAYVAAKTLANNVTTSSTTLTVTIKGADGLVHSLTTPITSSTAVPTAASINASVATYSPNNDITLNDAGDIANVKQSYLTKGMIMARFNAAGVNPGRAGVYFYSQDQYGTKAAPLAQVVLVSVTDANNNVIASPLACSQMERSLVLLM